MKQLSGSESNSLSKEDMAAMILQLQQVHSLNEKITSLNARHFGRSTENLSELPGQMNYYNEAEKEAEAPYAEPAIKEVVPRKKKQKGKQKDDLSQTSCLRNNSPRSVVKTDGRAFRIKCTAGSNISLL